MIIQRAWLLGLCPVQNFQGQTLHWTMSTISDPAVIGPSYVGEKALGRVMGLRIAYSTVSASLYFSWSKEKLLLLNFYSIFLGFGSLTHVEWM